MAARILVRVLLTLGFLAASVGYSSWTVQRTILDPSATRGATEALISTPSVRAMFSRELRTALAPAVGKGANSPKLAKAIDAAVADPKFVAAFEDAIMSMHEGLLSGRKSRITLDSAAVTTAIKHAVDRLDPANAPKLRRLKSVQVPVGGADLPHITGIRPRVTLVRNASIAIAILLVGGALLLSRNRKTFRGAGRRLAFVAAGPTLVFGVGPIALRATHKSGMDVAAAILEAYSHRVLWSAAIIAGVGISVWILTIAWPKPALAAADDAPIATPAYPTMPDTRMPSLESAALPEKVYL